LIVIFMDPPERWPLSKTGRGFFKDRESS